MEAARWDWEAREKRYQAIAECPPQLVGTSLDPVIATGEIIDLPRWRAEVKNALAERKEAKRQAEIKAMRAMPIQIKRFEC